MVHLCRSTAVHLPAALIDSELFGHERGAFTSAVSRKLGKVELAKGGTLFLDEVGDLTLETQARMLRLLEEGTYERVGGIETLSIQARIVAATNRDLEEMVNAGSFPRRSLLSHQCLSNVFATAARAQGGYPGPCRAISSIAWRHIWTSKSSL